MTEWEYKPAKDLMLNSVERFKSERREPGLVSYLTNRVATGGLRAYFQIYHRLRIEGGEHLPRKTPFVLISNHTSHLDALVLAACLPRSVRGSTYPIAAGDVFFETPPLAVFSSMVLNALPMWRKKIGRHALDDLRAKLLTGDCGYILFPEGTRSRDGRPGPFRPGLGMLVAGTSVPVVPCHLEGCHRALSSEHRVPRREPIRLRVGPAISFADATQDRDGWTHVAHAAEDAVFALSDQPSPRLAARG